MLRPQKQETIVLASDWEPFELLHLVGDQWTSLLPGTPPSRRRMVRKTKAVW